MIVILALGAGRLGRTHLELITAARELSGSLGSSVALVGLGEGAASVAAESGPYGVGKAVAVEGALADFGAEGYLNEAVRVLAALNPKVVLLNGDTLSREVGPRLAARLRGAAVNDVVKMRVEGERLICTRPVFGGKALADVAPRKWPVVAVLRPGAYAAAEASGGTAEVETLPAEAPASPVKVVERGAAEAAGVRLEEAEVVVSGGRGLGGPEGFQILKEVADLLGGAVGASLAAVDEGWAPPEWQIGQTGKSVSPKLYLAVGISGASQHLAGIAGAKAVVAINHDESAPIFRAARLGVVMDYRKILPALVEELKKVRAAG